VNPEGVVVFEESGEVDHLIDRVRDALKLKYFCPMHPAQRSEAPGTCPVCQMPLIER
jgi:rubrerythrin